MFYGFTFNSQHSGGFGIIIRSQNRVLLPAVQDTFKEIPGRDGSHLFPGALQDRIIEIECTIPEVTLLALRTKLRLVAAWLYTTDWAQLSFDDEPDRFYWARVSNQINLEQTIALGRFRVVFRCLPLAYGTEVSENFVNDLAIVENPGTCEALPVFNATITDAASEWKVTLNPAQYIRVVRNFIGGDVLEVNCGTGAVLVNGVRAMASLDWQNSRFFALPPGVSGLEITPSGICTASVTFVPRWL